MQFALGQDFTASWKGYFSYNQIIDIVQSDDEVIVASQNAIFKYDLTTAAITTISTVNGLNGGNISQIYYSQDKEILVVGYESGLIQLLTPDDRVLNVVAIVDKLTIPSNRKRINDFIERGNLLYIATDFGIALYDLNRLEFNDTYFIGDNAALLSVKRIALEGTMLFAASDDNGGMREANITDPFLLDFSNWTTINTGSFTNLTNFNGDLYASVGQFQYRYNGVNFIFQGQQPATILDYYAGAILRSTVFSNDVRVYNTNGVEVFYAREIEGVTYDLTVSTIVGNRLFLGTRDNGLIAIAIDNPTNIEYINANGPSRNAVFSVTSESGELWIGYGDHNAFYNPFPLEQYGVSRLVEDTWENFTNADILNVRSVASITINPDNPQQVYLNSMQDGVVEFQPGMPPRLYNQANSSLRGVGFGTVDARPADIRVSESAFDSRGNLWSLNLIRDKVLHRLSPAGQWTDVDISTGVSTIASNSGAGSIEITSGNQVLFGTVADGIIGYDPATGTVGNVREGVRQGGLIGNFVSALRLDQRGSLWIGSNLGLRVLFNSGSIFTDSPQDARSIVIEDSNGIPRELLDDEAVLDIEVDGNNNKWIATGSSGALLLSPSGNETIFQFTRDNSPLPDNEVRDISIDDTTGVIYFATKNGLVAFMGDRASKPQETLENVYAYPNPVRPGFDGNVTIDGLTSRARVKITDIEGNLVYEEVSNGGTILWDTRSFNGTKVASGVYMLFISTSDNIETKVSKLMIVR